MDYAASVDNYLTYDFGGYPGMNVDYCQRQDIWKTRK